MTSAFSKAAHSLPNTSLQFLLNHLLTLASSVNLLGLTAGAKGVIDLLVEAC